MKIRPVGIELIHTDRQTDRMTKLKGVFHDYANAPKMPPSLTVLSAVAYRGGVRVFRPPPEILKALQNCAKLNPIVKTVKNC